MNPVDATTGHSAKKERSVARVLYFCIIIGIGIAIAVAFIVGQDKAIQPPPLQPVEAVDVTPNATPTL